MTPEREFAAVCFLVLMGKGMTEHSPDYIAEKISMLNMGYDAFAFLDIHNMRKVSEWHEKWGVKMPQGPADYLAKSEDAAAELQARGVEI